MSQTVLYGFFWKVADELRDEVIGEMVVFDKAIDGVVLVGLLWIFEDNSEVSLEIEFLQVG